MPKIAHRGDPNLHHPKQVPNLNHLSWDDIRIFLVCCKEPSFRRAADKLNVSPSTVVRRIDQLEEALKTRLFDRLPEGVVLTPEALAIKASAQNMEKSLFELVHKRNQSDETVKGQVSISITEGLGTYWLMPRLVEFQRQFPSLILNVQCAMKSADVLRLEADVAIQFERPSNPDLIVAKIARLHVYPFASQEYIDLYGRPKKLSDAQKHRFVLQAAPQLQEEKVWAKKLGINSLDELIGIRTNSSTALFYAVERGAGIGVLPTYATALKAQVIPIDMMVQNSLDIWLTYHPSVKKIPRKSMVIEWLRSIFKPSVYPWFKDEFIHPNELAELMPPDASINFDNNYIAVKPFGH